MYSPKIMQVIFDDCILSLKYLKPEVMRLLQKRVYHLFKFYPTLLANIDHSMKKTFIERFFNATK